MVSSLQRQTAELRANRGAAISSRKRAIREWEEANPDADYDPDLFRREILPKLASVKLADIMAAAGISKGYASNVRAREVHAARLDVGGAGRAGGGQNAVDPGIP